MREPSDEHRSTVAGILFLLGLLLTAVALPVAAERVDVGGTLPGNTTWTAGNVYVLSLDVTVPAGVTLTIQPGTVVKGGNGLWISGSLFADGTPGAPIAFTSYHDDSRGGDTNANGTATAPGPGQWRGLIFLAGSHGRISNASVSYGGCGGYCYGKGNIESDTSDLRLEAVLIEYSGRDGLFANHASPTVTGCTIQHNGWSGLHFVGLDPAVPLNVTDNIFTSTGGGGGLLAFDGEPTPTTTFRGNRSSDGKCAFSMQGTANGDVVWDNGGDLVLYIPEDFVIAASRSLTLVPGTVVKTPPHNYSGNLWIDGFLFAEGTPDAPIAFTSYYDDSRGGDTNADGAASAPAPGNWRGVIFRAGSHGRISNASFSYGGCGGYCYGKANIETYTSGLELDKVLIEKSGKDGLYANHVSPAVTHCTIANNNGYGLRFNGLDPDFPLAVTDSVFTSTGGGGGMIAFDGQPSAPATFRGNRSSDGKCAFSVQGTANGDLLWDNGDDLPLYLPADFAVAATRTLTLKQGTVVKLGGTGLYLDGTLFAEGAQDSPVAFTSLQDDTRGGDTNADGGATTGQPGQWRGVYFRAGSHGTISNASFSYGGCGGYCYGRGLIVSSISDLHLDGVLLEKSGREGIWGIESGMTVKNSSILGNAYGIRNDSTQMWIDARYNWWGDASGPYHPTRNPSGKGQPVSDMVLFFPWAEDPSGTVSGVSVLVAGPTRMSPGQTVDYTVSYANWSEEPIADAVLSVVLPTSGSFVSCTGGGVRWLENQEVFWKLGALPPGSEGTVSLKVRYDWGLPNASQHTLMARLAGSNFAQEIMDVTAYWEYDALDLLGCAPISDTEFAAERAQVPDLDTLYSRFISEGFDFLGAYHCSMSDGGTITEAALGLPDRSKLVILGRTGPDAQALTLTRNTVSIEGPSGGASLDYQTSEVTSWGDWSPVRGEVDCTHTVCLENCGIEILKRTVSVKVAATSAAFFTGLALAPPLAAAAAVFGAGNLGYNVWRCARDCNQSHNTHCCDKPSIECTTHPLSGQDMSLTRDCDTSKGRLSAKVHPVTCTDITGGKKCVPGKGCTDCGAARDRRASAETSLPVSCTSTTVSPAKDPNAKYGPAGDVLPGQAMAYRVTCENEGQGRAYGVFILDRLSDHADEATLSVQNGGTYTPGARTIAWEIGELGPKGDPDSKAEVTFSVNLKTGLPGGTAVINQATVYFPSVPEETPTNPVVNVVQPVTATPQSVETDYCTPVAITLSGADVNGAPLSYSVVEGPYYGILTGTAPALTYTPIENYTGPDRFAFIAGNGTMDSPPADISITVNPSPADTTPPSAVWTDPGSGATVEIASGDPVWTDEQGPAYAPFVQGAFSENLAPASVTTQGFLVTQNGSGRSVIGTVSLGALPGLLVFVPREPWKSGTYTSSILAGLKDLSGNPTPAETSWSFTISAPQPAIPGDCDESGTVSIGEVQKAINMFLGTLAPDCGVDCNGDGTISIGEVQKVINGFLGMVVGC